MSYVHGKNYYVINEKNKTAIAYTFPIVTVHMDAYRNNGGNFDIFAANVLGLSSEYRNLTEEGREFIRALYNLEATSCVEEKEVVEKYGDFILLASAFIDKDQGIAMNKGVGHGRTIADLEHSVVAESVNDKYDELWLDSFGTLYEKAEKIDKPLHDDALPLRMFIVSEQTRDENHRYRVATPVPFSKERRVSKALTAPRLPFEYEYPTEIIQRDGGIGQDTEYTYVSSSFLNGLVNYGTKHVAYLLCRYGIEVDAEGNRTHNPDYVPTVEQYVTFAQTTIDQPHFKAAGDDWLIISETETSYMIFWYDQDVSDSSIERWSKENCEKYLGITSLREFEIDRIQAFVDQTLPGLHNFGSDVEPIMIRAGAIRAGWISG